MDDLVGKCENKIDNAVSDFKKKPEYELVKPWEERVRTLEGMVIVIMLYGFLMFFAGFLLGCFFIGAGM